MVLAMTPHRTPSVSNAYILVWKQAHGSKGAAVPRQTSQSVRSPSKSSTQTSGTATSVRPLAPRTALTSSSGVNADGEFSSWSSPYWLRSRIIVTPMVQNHPHGTKKRDGLCESRLAKAAASRLRSEEHTSELQSQ